MPIDKSHVFICGLHRSGTSVLNRIIQAHPLVTGFSGTGASEDEGQHLQSAIPHDGEFGGPGVFCFDSRAHLTEYDLLQYATHIPMILEDWERHWDNDCAVRVEKSPPNLIRSRFLQEAFPNSRFVFIVRHPLIVSMATQKWCQNSLEDLILHWVEGHRIMLEDIRFLKHFHVVRYEDIAIAPNEALSKIWQFIGVRAQVIPSDIFVSRNDHYLKRARSLPPPFAGRLPHGSSEVMRRFCYTIDAPYVHCPGDWAL